MDGDDSLGCDGSAPVYLETGNCKLFRWVSDRLRRVQAATGVPISAVSVPRLRSGLQGARKQGGGYGFTVVEESAAVKELGSAPLGPLSCCCSRSTTKNTMTQRFLWANQAAPAPESVSVV